MADEAGVRLSLVHYHFGGKQGLLLEVLERENELLLARQRELYAAPGPAGREVAHGLRLPRRGRPLGLRARAVGAVGRGARRRGARRRLARGDGRLARRCSSRSSPRWAEETGVELPLSPARASRRSSRNLFEGIEIELLAGVPPEDAPHREVLDAIGVLIERAEAKA